VTATNEFVSALFVESIDRLALGIEPLDAYRSQRIPTPLDFSFEAAPLPSRRFTRHNTCVFTVLAAPPIKTPLDIRIQDAARRFVPRRLRFPLSAAAEPTAAERTRRPVMFPGAAYDVAEASTGLRGRVLRGGAPMRWAWVIARLPPTPPAGARTGIVVGRARGDDRGEFLLLIDSQPLGVGALPTDFTLTLEVAVYGPQPTPPHPATPAVPLGDPLWDLPQEVASAAGAPDPVSAGEALPAGYDVSGTSTVEIDFTLGRFISTGASPIIF
jgi:hypothetical protein